MELLESMVENRASGKKRNFPHSDDGWVWVPPLLLSVACVAASCAGAGRSMADILNAFRRAAADCVGQALAAGARTRHSAAMMIGTVLAITGRWRLIGFLLLFIRVLLFNSLRTRRNLVGPLAAVN